MKRNKIRLVILILAVTLGIMLSIFIYKVYHFVLVVNSLAAHTICAGLFISGFDESRIAAEDIADILKFPVRYDVDYKNKSVAAYFPGGIAKREAQFRKGLGVTLLSDISREELLKQQDNIAEFSASENSFWPSGDKNAELADFTNINKLKLENTVNEAFIDNGTDYPAHTRAVIVIYNNRIAAEKYAKGITKKTPLIGWSMTKSITSALIGIYLNESGLTVKETVPVAEWSDADDRRNTITYDNLLRMNSGLDYKQKPKFPDIRDEYREVMLEHDAGKYAADRKLRSEPGKQFYYMNGSTNILMSIMKNSLGKAYLSYPWEKLFSRIGMNTAVIAPDSSGGFIGSSFGWASARDWARFGMLYLNNGVWNGTQVLPRGWVDYTRTPSKAAPGKGGYGASFWLNTPDGTSRNMMWPEMPVDTYTCQGSEGQIIAIIPSQKLVIVRLGMTKGSLGAKFDRGKFISDISSAFPK